MEMPPKLEHIRNDCKNGVVHNQNSTETISMQFETQRHTYTSTLSYVFGAGSSLLF